MFVCGYGGVMAKPKIKWHDIDFTEVMKSAEVEQILLDQAQACLLYTSDAADE